MSAIIGFMLGMTLTQLAISFLPQGWNLGARAAIGCTVALIVMCVLYWPGIGVLT